MNTKTVTVPNISCEHCTRTIEMELSDLKGVQTVNAEETSKQVTVTYDDSTSWEQIRALLEEINYPPSHDSLRK